MSWLAEIYPSPNARKPLTQVSFLKVLLPALILYYITAFLIIIRGTRKIRIALLPLTLWTLFRAATSLDVSANFAEPRLSYLNQGLVLMMTTLGMRVIIWSCRLEPYVRHPLQKNKVAPNGNMHTNQDHRVHNAFELCFSLRGCDWNWSEGLYVAKETRSTSRTSFALSTAVSLVVGIIAFDCIHFFVQYLDPKFALSTGGSIYDMSLTPIPRYLRSSGICVMAGLTFYSSIQVYYDIGTLIGIVVLRQYPSQWPPIFQYPWLADSLSDFWARRWHQLFRDCFVALGYKPMSAVAGRAGGVLGAFFISGILHDFGLWGMGNGMEPSRVSIFFLMMGIGVVLENAWKDRTGYKVGGILGKVWTGIWLVGWSHLLIDVYCRKGVVASMFFPDEYRPSVLLMGLGRHMLRP
ncbi:hypothetical protein AX15_001987 [Amanita polypyramis BW_CC]|nr:hypothetical protein AX15_001987 [Amanita polypyramis BW_CC]